MMMITVDSKINCVSPFDLSRRKYNKDDDGADADDEDDVTDVLLLTDDTVYCSFLYKMCTRSRFFGWKREEERRRWIDRTRLCQLESERSIVRMMRHQRKESKCNTGFYGADVNGSDDGIIRILELDYLSQKIRGYSSW